MDDVKSRRVLCAGMSIKSFRRLIEDMGADNTKIDYVCLDTYRRRTDSLIAKWPLVMHLAHDKDRIVIILGIIIEGTLESFDNPVILV